LGTNGSLRDTDADGCWDVISGRTASGSTFAYDIIDGQCNGMERGQVKAQVVTGSIESGEFTIMLVDALQNATIAVLIKDQESSSAYFIPRLMQDEVTYGTLDYHYSPIGLQMSVAGDQAHIVVPDRMTAAVNLMQTESGKTLSIFDGQLDAGTTTITVPSTVASGAYVLTVVTDRGTQTVAFTLQR
jgi:hypothetical protein